MSINTATATMEDIKAAETVALLALYNKITKQSVKKFKDRKTAEARTWNAIQQLGVGEDISKTDNEKPAKTAKIEKKTRAAGKRKMRFCFAPGNPKELRIPREGSLRKKVFDLLNRKNGATFTEIQEAFGWHVKNTYEAIRLVHRTTNYGMWNTQEKNGDLRIYLLLDSKEYKELIQEEKKAA